MAAWIVRTSTSDYGESAQALEAVWFTFCLSVAARMTKRCRRELIAVLWQEMSIHQTSGK
jgi:hypothetical protein